MEHLLDIVLPAERKLITELEIWKQTLFIGKV